MKKKKNPSICSPYLVYKHLPEVLRVPIINHPCHFISRLLEEVRYLMPTSGYNLLDHSAPFPSSDNCLAMTGNDAYTDDEWWWLMPRILYHPVLHFLLVLKHLFTPLTFSYIYSSFLEVNIKQFQLLLFQQCSCYKPFFK